MGFTEGFEHWDQQHEKWRHVCPMCGKTFHSRKRTGVTYCGQTCRKRASDGHTTFKTTFVCEHCGGMGTTAQPFQHKRYCSNACRQAAYRSRRG